VAFPSLIEAYFHQIVDFWFAVWPQPVPPKTRLCNCKIISHRGEHDNRTVFENTLAAFDRVYQAGGWGIEFDIRWTKDLQPVVVHDPDMMRVFQEDLQVRESTLRELKARCPLVPDLAEVVHHYGGKMHLMIEIKAEDYPAPGLQSRVLQDQLSKLIPHSDYHLLSLAPEMLTYWEWCPRTACLPIAELNYKALSDLALKAGYGGVNGHYLFISNAILNKHRKADQRVGTGFISSSNCLFRELNRGVEWIYTNHALRLLKICKAHNN
jgi:glycerophosphoryl diester phosphodiesterase